VVPTLGRARRCCCCCTSCPAAQLVVVSHTHTEDVMNCAARGTSRPRPAALAGQAWESGCCRALRAVWSSGARNRRRWPRGAAYVHVTARQSLSHTRSPARHTNAATRPPPYGPHECATRSHVDTRSLSLTCRPANRATRGPKSESCSLAPSRTPAGRGPPEPELRGPQDGPARVQP
jgi:hypothetical protein